MGQCSGDQTIVEGERVRMSAGGRIVIPQHMRQAIGIEPGHELLLRMDGDCLRVYSLPSAVRQSQAIVQRYVSKDRMLSEELLRDRKQETEDE
jgi:bifunctional DNA-binding transcriptional regulator/antitoxin component of YhaV-PrlF toxin-antitoxin module